VENRGTSLDSREELLLAERLEMGRAMARFASGRVVEAGMRKTYER
jgi:hypothetical protein